LRELARAMEGIGACHIQGGQRDRAVAVLSEALVLYRRIGSPRAERVLATLAVSRPTPGA
jgi:Tfp pilus assembly protein PilF